MKHFIIAVLTGLLFAILGFGLLVIVYMSVDLNLNCRDCQGAGGALLLILVVVVAGCFIVGLVVGGIVSKLRSRNTDIAKVEVETIPDTPSEPATRSSSVTRANLKVVIALFLVAIILIAFFYNALSK